MKKVATISIFLSLGTLISLLLALTLGVFDTPDSLFYIGIGQYLHTGILIQVRPFNMFEPQTLFGPVYGLLIAPLLSLPAPIPMIGVPFVQYMSVFFSGMLLSIVIREIAGNKWGFRGLILYLLLPFQLIYASLLMSETLTQFWIALYIFWLYFFLRKKSWAHPGVLVCVAVLVTLTRYVYAVLLVPALMLWIGHWIYDVRQKTLADLSIWKRVVHLFLSIILPCVAIYVLISWMQFTYTHTGKFSLTNVVGRHIYNNVVTAGKLLPPNDSPALQEFLLRFPDRDALFVPWWRNQLYFANANHPMLSEERVDDLYMHVSLDAIREHPAETLWHELRMIARLPFTPPYIRPEMTKELTLCQTPVCEYCANDAACRIPWNANLCTTPVQFCPLQQLTGRGIEISTRIYPILQGILLILALLGAIRALQQKSQFLISVSLLFGGLWVIQAITEWTEGRFLLPLYPLYILLIIQGAGSMLSLAHRFRRQ